MIEIDPVANQLKMQERTKNSVLRQLTGLRKMNKDQLVEKWRDLYGNEPPQYKKQYLAKRLAHRIQEILHGGISKPAKEYLQKGAGADPVATINSKIPLARKNEETILPGTRFVRIWKDRRYEVIAAENSFEYAGRKFRSLSAVAREITGTRWNGKVFFGLKKGSGGKRNA